MEQNGFVGTGTIGAPMARRLLETGHAFVVHDLRAEALAPLVQAGAQPAASPREVALRCRIVLASLPGPAEVEAVALGDAGLLAGARRGEGLLRDAPRPRGSRGRGGSEARGLDSCARAPEEERCPTPSSNATAP